MNGKVRIIPPSRGPLKHVAIYVRVSSNSIEQLESLKTQISGLTRHISNNYQWRLFDIYIDIASSKKGSSRPEFQRMIEECEIGFIDIVFVKNISRLGRDTVEVLDAIHRLRQEGVKIIFMQERLDTLVTDDSILISTIEAYTQAENESRSANINWGMMSRAVNGTLGFFNRPCYGYKKNDNGELIINDIEAKNVKLVFDLYLEGKSIMGILKELDQRKISSPKGKDRWPKHSVEVMLKNEKYTGTAVEKATVFCTTL